MKFVEVFRGRVSVDRIASVAVCGMGAHSKYSTCYILYDDKARELGHVSERQVEELEKSTRRVIPNTTGTKGWALTWWRDAGERMAHWSPVTVVGWEIVANVRKDGLPYAIPVFASEAESNRCLFTENHDGSLTEWCVWSGEERIYLNREAAEAKKPAEEAA